MCKRIILSVVMLIGLFLMLPAAALGQVADPLVGTRWQLSAYGQPDAETPIIEGSTVTLEFNADNAVTGSGGCNFYGGSYEIDGETITMSEIISTMMACTPDALMTQETAYLNALSSVTRYAVASDVLTLIASDGQQLVFVRAASLPGTQWHLLAYGTPGAETPVIAAENSRVTLELGMDNRVRGVAGCNQYSGSMMLNGDRLTFSEIAQTEMACLDDALMQQEQTFLNALLTVTQYALVEGNLIMTYDENQQLVFGNALALSRWQLSAYGQPGAETPASADSRPTLAFGVDNAVGGSGGCNTYGGSYTLNGDLVTFSQLISTRMACMPEALMTQEAAFLTLLSSATRYAVAGDVLTIFTTDGQTLVFDRLMTDR